MTKLTERQLENINRNRRLYLDEMQPFHLDIVRLNSGNTLEHELKKAEIAYNLAKDGARFVTETKLKNGKRPDILVLDTVAPIAYEVACSEKEESLLKKQETYAGIKIQVVRIDKNEYKGRTE